MRSFILGLAAAGLLTGVVSSVAQTTAPARNSDAPSTVGTVKNNDPAAASGNSNQAIATTNADAPSPASGSNRIMVSLM